MADGAILNIGVQRNEDYLRVFRFTNSDDDTAFDVSGWTFEFRINSATGLGDPPLILVSGTATTNGSVITVEDSDDGRVSIKILKEDLEYLPGRRTNVINYAYNLIATNAGNRRAVMRGTFTAEPGV